MNDSVQKAKKLNVMPPRAEENTNHLRHEAHNSKKNAVYENPNPSNANQNSVGVKQTRKTMREVETSVKIWSRPRKKVTFERAKRTPTMLNKLMKESMLG